MTKLYCRNKTLELDRPAIMGILNLTPDSFYDGGRLGSENDALKKAGVMLEEGASIIDVGGMSSRPGASIISENEELSRVAPVLESLIKRFPEAIYSVDTIRASVAKAALDVGAHIINDISAGRFDAEMLKTVASSNAALVIMHMQGMPAFMQENPTYENVTNEVKLFFEERIGECSKAGVTQLILDPGFGFGKTIEHNYQLLKNIPQFLPLRFPVLVGLSRKSMVNKVLNISAKEALNGTTALNTIALLNGAKILRVHDVKEARETAQLVERYLNNDTAL